MRNLIVPSNRPHGQRIPSVFPALYAISVTAVTCTQRPLPLTTASAPDYRCDSSREGGRTEEALSRYPDRKESHEGDTRPETAVFTRILN
jgi:hypothetical protein